MILNKLCFFTAIFIMISAVSTAQVVINEGSNRNYSCIADENGEFPDWIELYNTGAEPVISFELFPYR